MSKRSLEEALGLTGSDQESQPEASAELDPRHSMWQRQAAQAAGLPPLVAGRLVGDTEDELQADAKRLADSLNVEAEQQAPSVEALILARKQQSAIAKARELVRPRRVEDDTARGPDFGS